MKKNVFKEGEMGWKNKYKELFYDITSYDNNILFSSN